MAEQVAIDTALIDVANSPSVKGSRQFAETAADIDVETIREMYLTLRDTAPQRHGRNRRYFVGHSGIPSTRGSTNRIEEHLAIALCNDQPVIEFAAANTLSLLDYQVPLKATQADAGIGKVDIVGLTDLNRLTVVELKVTTSTSRGDTPLRAVLESLAYCAIVDANGQDIASEVRERFGRCTAGGRPGLAVLGPHSYWTSWSDTQLAAVEGLSDRLARSLEIHIRFIDLGEVSVNTGSDGSPPQLVGKVMASEIYSSTPAPRPG